MQPFYYQQNNRTSGWGRDGLLPNPAPTGQGLPLPLQGNVLLHDIDSIVFISYVIALVIG